MKRFALCLVFVLTPFMAHADDYDPTALHDRGNQKLIGDLEVVGKVTAGEIATSSGVSLGGTNDCRPGWMCVSNIKKTDKLGIINLFRTFSGLGESEAASIISSAENVRMVDGYYEAFDLNWACTGEHKGIFGEGSSAVCGKSPLEVSSASVGTLTIETARVNDGLTARAATITGGLTASSLYASGGLAVNGVSAVNQLNAHAATFDRAPLIPLVHYGLEIHAEHGDGFSGCTSEQAASFEADVRAVLEENLPGATLISVQCGSRVSFLSPIMLSDLKPVPPVFRMFDSVSIYHPFQDYYENTGESYSKMECGGESHGSIAVTVDGLGAALIVCRHEAERGIVSYRRYSSSAELIQF